jgi:hypothetical protein
VVKAYLQRQFNQLSWWPTEQPWKAKEEFEVMHNTPERLTAWCEKWLDGGEWRKLKKAIQNRRCVHIVPKIHQEALKNVSGSDAAARLS